MSLKPWREIAVPHPDVLEGTFQQSEFAADITAVHIGKATREYQDAAAFFERTFITEGMRLLLTSVVRRLNGQGGDPVIQLQTAFGGGKTHTMLAVYHLATRKCALKDLPGIPALLDHAKLMDLPQARVVVLDGTVKIIKLVTGNKFKTLVALGVGDFFGEMALLDGNPRSASAIAHGVARVLRVGRDEFSGLMSENPYLGLKVVIRLARCLTDRLRKTNEQVVEMVSWNLQQREMNKDQ
jgi:hypothetical protein